MQGWLPDEERLIVFIVLDDEIGESVAPGAADTFFRAFIVENRTTGRISCRFRYRYVDREAWYVMVPDKEVRKQSRAFQVTYLQEYMERSHYETLRELAHGIPVPKEVIQSFWIPDDDGDPQKTLDWLVKQKLIYCKGDRSA